MLILYSNTTFSYHKYQKSYLDKQHTTNTAAANFSKHFQNKDNLVLSLENALILSSYAKKVAEEIGVPVSIAVVDSSGDTITLHRMDNCMIASIDLAVLKAKTAVYYNCDTRTLSKNTSLKPLNRIKTKDIELGSIENGYLEIKLPKQSAIVFHVE